MTCRLVERVNSFPSISRRAIFGMLATSALRSAAGLGLRFSICNETYGRLPFADQCRITKRAGYQGLEIAPFTLAADPGAIPPAVLAECRRILAGEGLGFAGLHSLL